MNRRAMLLAFGVDISDLSPIVLDEEIGGLRGCLDGFYIHDLQISYKMDVYDVTTMSSPDPVFMNGLKRCDISFSAYPKDVARLASFDITSLLGSPLEFEEPIGDGQTIGGDVTIVSATITCASFSGPYAGSPHVEVRGVSTNIKIKAPEPTFTLRVGGVDADKAPVRRGMRISGGEPV